MRRLISITAAIAATTLFVSPAFAQVMEIGHDGSVAQIGGGWSLFPTASAVVAAFDAPARFRPAIEAAAARYDLSPNLIAAVARSESGFDPDIVSDAGAIGVMQLMPGTARDLGVDPWDPTQNIMGGAAYLRQQLNRFDGDLSLALAAYNAGPGRVIQYRGVPPIKQTIDYVAINLDRLASASLSRVPTSNAQGEF